MSNIITFIAMTLALVLGWRHVQAAEPTALTLSCDGKVTNAKADDTKPEPVNKMGLVVNLAERTVSFLCYVVQITSIDAANVGFSGENQTGSVVVSVYGDIDRVTGAVSATIWSKATVENFDLLCKPASRLF